jgi:hypothetical protein
VKPPFSFFPRILLVPSFSFNFPFLLSYFSWKKRSIDEIHEQIKNETDSPAEEFVINSRGWSRTAAFGLKIATNGAMTRDTGLCTSYVYQYCALSCHDSEHRQKINNDEGETRTGSLADCRKAERWRRRCRIGSGEHIIMVRLRISSA